MGVRPHQPFHGGPDWSKKMVSRFFEYSASLGIGVLLKYRNGLLMVQAYHAQSSRERLV